MKQTVNEWVNFLAVDDSQRFNIFVEGNQDCPLSPYLYLTAERFKTVFAPFMNEIPRKVYAYNWSHDGIDYHAFELKKEWINPPFLGYMFNI